MAKKKKPVSKMQAQKDIGDLFKHIQEQNFGTMEELQAFLNQTIGKTVDDIIPKKQGKQSNEEIARDKIFEAYETPSIAKGRKLVQEALKLDPENVDGYTYLADTAPNVEQAISTYQKGVEVGRKVLGEAFFKEQKGHFWLIHETRPFMNAKAGLAGCLYFNKKYDESIKHYQELLELNPNDNQGVRYELAVCLVEQSRYEDYLKLYKNYKDDINAMWKFTYALYLFRVEGSSLKAMNALKKAHEANPFVTQFFANEKKLPKSRPEYVGFGDENEAVECLLGSGNLWLETPGAMTWLLDFHFKQKKMN